jgi:hypothetical protein
MGLAAELFSGFTRRGLEYPALLTGSEIRRATGRGWMFCAVATPWQTMTDTSISVARVTEEMKVRERGVSEGTNCGIVMKEGFRLATCQAKCLEESAI